MGAKRWKDTPQRGQTTRTQVQPFGPPPGSSEEVLERLPRGPDMELRVSANQLNGHEFLSLRVWRRATWGARPWLPTTTGCTLRLHEVEAVASVLAAFCFSRENPEPVEAPAEPEPTPEPSLTGQVSDLTPPWEGPSQFADR